MTARRPADIAALTERLRRFAAAWRAAWIDGERQADDLDTAADLLARWPTADEIAGAREAVEFMLNDESANTAVRRLLDRLDPPQPQADENIRLARTIDPAYGLADPIPRQPQPQADDDARYKAERDDANRRIEAVIAICHEWEDGVSPECSGMGETIRAALDARGT